MKKLVEKMNAFKAEMNELVEKAKKEQRAMSEEEIARFDELEAQVKALLETIEREKKQRELPEIADKGVSDGAPESQAEKEERAFGNHIRGIVEERAEVNMTVTDNGAVIPTSIADKIIKKVINICPIYQKATRYNVGGTLTIPYYDESTQAITMTYATEFKELESNVGKFTSIQLNGYLAGALSLISKSVINNSKFDIVNFVIDAMAESISKWIEGELLNGTSDKIAGLSGATQTVTAAAANVITADELIDLQETVPDVFQGNAMWIMSKGTRTAIRKLKDGDGTYLLQKDSTAQWGYTLFGKPVYTSDNMSDMSAGKTAVYYGDMSGLAVKLSEDITIDVAREKYITQHAVGVVAWVELDAKVENAQKISKLVMHA